MLIELVYVNLTQNTRDESQDQAQNSAYPDGNHNPNSQYNSNNHVVEVLEVDA